MKKISYLILIVISLLIFNSSVKAQNTVGTIYNSTMVQDGYVLYEFMGDTTIYLIDNCGRVVNQWESDYTAGTSIYLLEDGSLIRSCKIPTTSFPTGGQGGLIQKFDWDGNQTWEFLYSDATHCLHHDFAVMPNGNILAIAFELKTEQECIDAGRDTSMLADDELWPETIIEIQPTGPTTGIIVWEWHMWDHLIQDHDNTKPNYGVVGEHPELFDLNNVPSDKADWAHANALDYNAVLDQVVISLNSFSEIVIVDHSTSTAEAAGHTGGNMGKGGDILFRYGNPENYHHGDSTDRVNYKQHNVQWIPDSLVDGGKIMLYNNGNGRPGGDASSIDIIDPMTDINGNYILEADTTFGPDVPEWTYVAPVSSDFYSPNISGAQRLTNGHTIICQGRDGRIFEIDSNKDIVWEYWSPLTNGGTLTQGDAPAGGRNVFRAVRYYPDYPAFVGKDMTPGAPIELNPDLTDCLDVSIAENIVDLNHTVYPNPANDWLNFSLDRINNNTVVIYDITGKVVHRSTLKTNTINISNLKTGLYFVNVDGVTSKIMKK